MVEALGVLVGVTLAEVPAGFRGFVGLFGGFVGCREVSGDSQKSVVGAVEGAEGELCVGVDVGEDDVWVSSPGFGPAVEVSMSGQRNVPDGGLTGLEVLVK